MEGVIQKPLTLEWTHCQHHSISGHLLFPVTLGCWGHWKDLPHLWELAFYAMPHAMG